MNTQEHHRLADQLHEAERSRSPIDPLTASNAGMTEHDAYAVQLINAARALKDGQRLVGYKVGLTSREAQRHFGVFEPDFGHLFDEMAVDDDGEIAMSALIQPKIEGEIAFVLGRDLKGPGVTYIDALRSVDAAVAAMEIVDSRIRDWKIKGADTIADNGSSSRFVLGSLWRRPTELDLPTIGMALSKNGEVELTGAGAAVMGNPLSALVFLANELGRHDRGLVAGEVILSGSLGGMIKVAAGDFYTCEMARLGSVSVRFTEGERHGSH